MGQWNDLLSGAMTRYQQPGIDTNEYAMGEQKPRGVGIHEAIQIGRGAAVNSIFNMRNGDVGKLERDPILGSLSDRDKVGLVKLMQKFATEKLPTRRAEESGMETRPATLGLRAKLPTSDFAYKVMPRDPQLHEVASKAYGQMIQAALGTKEPVDRQESEIINVMQRMFGEVENQDLLNERKTTEGLVSM